MVEVGITLVQHPIWARGPASVEDNEVILDESRAERYGLNEPEQVERMAFDLAAMAFHGSGRDPQQVVAFIRRYGLLWHGADEIGSGSCRESLSDWWHEADEAYLMAATTSAARLIHQGMQDTMWGMSVIKLGELRWTSYPPNLVGAEYANLGTLISKRVEFKECPGCGRVFLPGSGKQKYHDQQCAARTRQRRWQRGKGESG